MKRIFQQAELWAFRHPKTTSTIYATIQIGFFGVVLWIDMQLHRPLSIHWILFAVSMLFASIAFFALLSFAQRNIRTLIGDKEETGLTQRAIEMVEDLQRGTLRLLPLVPDIRDEELLEMAANLTDEEDRKIIEDGLAWRQSQRLKNASSIVEIQASDNAIGTEESSVGTVGITGTLNITQDDHTVNATGVLGMSGELTAKILTAVNDIAEAKRKVGRRPTEINEIVYRQTTQGKEFPEAWEAACKEYNSTRAKGQTAIDPYDTSAREAARSAFYRRRDKENPRN